MWSHCISDEDENNSTSSVVLIAAIISTWIVFRTMNIHKIPLNVFSKGIKTAYVRRTLDMSETLKTIEPKVERVNWVDEFCQATTVSLENIHELLKLSTVHVGFQILICRFRISSLCLVKWLLWQLVEMLEALINSEMELSSQTFRQIYIRKEATNPLGIACFEILWCVL